MGSAGAEVLKGKLRGPVCVSHLREQARHQPDSTQQVKPSHDCQSPAQALSIQEPAEISTLLTLEVAHVHCGTYLPGHILRMLVLLEVVAVLAGLLNTGSTIHTDIHVSTTLRLSYTMTP